MNIKLVLIGASASGKTSILYRIQHETFIETTTTLSISVVRKEIEYNSQKVYLQMWDTAGQERFDCITPTYYRSCQAIGITCSVDSYESLQKAHYWYNQIKQYADANVKLYLIVNKIDLVDNVQLTDAAVQGFAASHELLIFKTSALTGDGVNEFVEQVLYDCTKDENVGIEKSISLEQVKRGKCC
ncbi:Rab1a [Hexamita inflata]|uniref:Rab1a n=1 Tax=Hexamita inflata TaxID=28002 RepID=A0AA86U9N7_9EUKA|nr:Rab1a [Hexamita inflata]